MSTKMKLLSSKNVALLPLHESCKKFAKSINFKHTVRIIGSEEKSDQRSTKSSCQKTKGEHKSCLVYKEYSLTLV